MNLRCDQFLFLDIVKQSYEAERAWKKWIKEYCILSEKERNAYILFSINTKHSINTKQRLLYDNERYKSGRLSDIVFEIWCGLDDNEWNKWLNETENELKSPFRDVKTFLNTFSHHC